MLEGLAVQALLHEARSDGAAAARALRESLDDGGAGGDRPALRLPRTRRSLRSCVDCSPNALPHPHARIVLAALEAVLAASRRASQRSRLQPRTLAENPLTERELEVVRLLERRLTNNEIGEELFISPITVKNHVAHITDKLGVSGRRAAVERAGELGLVRADS